MILRSGREPRSERRFLKCRIFVAMASLFCLFTAPGKAWSAEITILSPGATEGVLTELIPQFEKATGHRVKIEYGPVGGLAARVRRGEPVDVVILSDSEAERLRTEAHTAEGTQTVLAKVGIGVFVSKGAAKPDIGTPDAFLSALSNAKAIAYADPRLGGSASILVDKLLRSLDAAGPGNERIKLSPPAKPLVDLVAAGGADFGFQPISQIFLDSRIEYVGPLPARYQLYTEYVASLVASSQHQVPFNELIAFLTSAAATATWKSKGFGPR
jgi:molybdate transport system substrate-binding protein